MTSHGKLRKEKGSLAEYETQIKGKRNQFDSRIFSKDVCANPLTAIYKILCEKNTLSKSVGLYSLYFSVGKALNFN